eukprot:3094415-Alexandrium_andersonii.AAC.1
MSCGTHCPRHAAPPDRSPRAGASSTCEARGNGAALAATRTFASRGRPRAAPCPAIPPPSPAAKDAAA